MEIWSNNPFVRIMLAFLPGIFISYFLGESGDRFFLPLVVIFLLFIFSLLLLHKYISYDKEHYWGMLLFATVMLSGFLWHNSYVSYRYSNHFSTRELDDSTVYTGKVMETSIETAYYFKVLLQIEELRQCSEEPIKVSGLMMAYFPKEALAENLRYGNRVLFKAQVKEIAPPSNPDMFNYKKYLAQRYIINSCRIDSGEYKLLSRRTWSVYAWAQDIRMQILDKYKSYGIDGRELALLSIMGFGYKRYQDVEDAARYADAGVMHVLCVSGLHVGIVYLALILLFSPIMKRRQRWRNIGELLIVILMWGFAFITGLGVAVCRAVLMFSFISFGKLMKREVSTENILAFTAFILALHNPNVIFYVGFQLSFLAVIAILWIFPHVDAWFGFKVKFFKKIWSIIAISISVNVLIFPLLAYYFHKMSFLFLISNLLIIPLATLILYLVVFSLAVSFLHWPFFILTWVLRYLLMAMNNCVSYLSMLSFAIFGGIYIEFWQLILIYVVFLPSLHIVITKRRLIPHVLLANVIMLMVIFISIKFQKQMREEMILYHISGGFALGVDAPERGVIIIDSLLYHDSTGKLGYATSAYWEHKYRRPDTLLYSNIIQYDNSVYQMEKPFAMFLHHTIFFLDTTTLPLCGHANPFEVDYLIIVGMPSFSWLKLLEIVKIKKQVLISGSIPYYKAKRLKKFFLSHQQSCYLTHEEGAFVFPPPEKIDIPKK